MKPATKILTEMSLWLILFRMIKTHKRLKRTPILLGQHKTCAYFQGNPLFQSAEMADFDTNVAVAHFVPDDQNTQEIKKSASFSRTTQTIGMFSG